MESIYVAAYMNIMLSFASWNSDDLLQSMYL